MLACAVPSDQLYAAAIPSGTQPGEEQNGRDVRVVSLGDDALLAACADDTEHLG